MSNPISNGLIAKQETPQRELIEPGTYLARCYSMVHYGNIPGEYEGKANVKSYVGITFELPTEMKVFKEGDEAKPRVISKEMAVSLGDKSKMRPFLESWRGKKFTEEEVKSFDLTKLVGAPCLLGIGHKEHKGKTYEEIISISTPMKGTVVPDLINSKFIFTWDKYQDGDLDKFPTFIQEKMKKSLEYQHIISGGLSKASNAESIQEDQPDELPF